VGINTREIDALRVMTWLLDEPTGRVTNTDEFVPGNVLPAA
jgi:hypothetical protein